jgi:hypothetical protein
VKMIKIKDFRNPKNLSQEWIGGSKKKHIKK